MLTQRELDILNLEAQQKVNSYLDEFMKQWLGGRNEEVYGQAGRQLGENSGEPVGEPEVYGGLSQS